MNIRIAIAKRVAPMRVVVIEVPIGFRPVETIEVQPPAN